MLLFPVHIKRAWHEPVGKERKKKIMQKCLLATILVVVVVGIMGCGGGGNDLAPAGPNPEEQVAQYGNLEGFISDAGDISGPTRSVSVSLADPNGSSRSSQLGQIVSVRDQKTRATDTISSWRDEIKGGKVSITFFKIDQPVENPIRRGKHDLNPNDARWSVSLPYGIYAVRALGYPAGQNTWTLIDVQNVEILPDVNVQPVHLRMVKREQAQAQIEASAGFADEAVLLHTQGAPGADLKVDEMDDIDWDGLGVAISSGGGLLWKHGVEVGDFNVAKPIPGTFVWRVSGLEQMFGQYYIYGYDWKLYRGNNPSDNWPLVEGLPFSSSVCAMTSQRQSDGYGLYVGTNYDGVWHTADRGESWTQLVSGVRVAERSLHFENGVITFLDNGDNVIMRSSDLGKTWTSSAIPVEPYKYPQLFYVSNDEMVLACWSLDVCYRTTDGGQSWEDITLPQIRGIPSHYLFTQVAQGRIFVGMYDTNYSGFRIIEYHPADKAWHGVVYLGNFRPWGVQLSHNGILYVSCWGWDPGGAASYHMLRTYDANSIR